MKLGFICPNAPGHLNPMTALARELQARKYDVVFLYASTANGLPAVPGPEEDHVTKMLREVSALHGEDAFRVGIRSLLAQTESILKSLPEIVRTNRVDALILDTTQRYVELGAMNLDIPYLHVSVALHFDYSGYTPPIYQGWPHETTPQALARNREGVAQITEKLATANDQVRAYAERSGLEVDWADLSSTLSKRAWITQTPEAFDFDSPYRPPQFHHTGPFHDGKGREKVDFPWEQLTGEPVVYASMGTILNGRVDVFRTIAAAAARHRDMQLVLSVGDQVDPAQIGPVPGNAIIVKRAPQLELLKKASLCITHAGLNTVLESLTQGVPQVAIPVSFDQPGVAARIADRKTGVVTSLDKLTPDHLAELLSEVQNNPIYRQNSRKLQHAIVEADGLAVAADLVETSLGAVTKTR